MYTIIRNQLDNEFPSQSRVTLRIDFFARPAMSLSLRSRTFLGLCSVPPFIPRMLPRRAHTMTQNEHQEYLDQCEAANLVLANQFPDFDQSESSARLMAAGPREAGLSPTSCHHLAA